MFTPTFLDSVELGARVEIAMWRESRFPEKEVRMRIRDAQTIARAKRLIAQRKGDGDK